MNHADGRADPIGEINLGHSGEEPIAWSERLYTYTQRSPNYRRGRIRGVRFRRRSAARDEEIDHPTTNDLGGNPLVNANCFIGTGGK